MRFVASQADLAAALATVSRAVSSRNPMPILSGVLLTVSGQSITLNATDLSLAMETTVPADVKETGAVVLPARYFTEIVRRLPPGPVTVTVDPVGHTATVEWDKSRFTVHGQAADHFPPTALPDREPDYRLPQPRLRELIRQTVFAVSADVTRPILTGVNVMFEPPEVTFLATDGIRAVRSRAEVQALGGAGASAAVLPARTLQELGRLLDDAGSDVSIWMSDRQVSFDLGTVRLFSRVLDGEFPTAALMKLIENTDAKTRVRSPLSFLHDACERAGLIVRGESAQIKMDISGAEMTVQAIAAEVGQVYEEIAATVDGDPLQIYINPHLVLDGLRALTADDVLLEFTGTHSAVRMKTADGDEFCYVLMPQAAPVG